MNEPSISRDWSEIFQNNKLHTLSRTILHPRYMDTSETQRSMRFCTGSSYRGGYNDFGFAGWGVYIYPHGAIYQGNFMDGQFHGEGTIQFPKGQILEGSWQKGKLIKYTYKYADGLEYTNHFNYLTSPDRSYQIENNERKFQPPGQERLTNTPRNVQKGCYDTGDGYYDPSKQYVMKNGHVLRIVTKEEEDLIKRLFMCNADKSVGFKPDLYEYWTTGSSKEHRKIPSDIELLKTHGIELLKTQEPVKRHSNTVHTSNYRGTESRLTLYTCLDESFYS